MGPEAHHLPVISSKAAAYGSRGGFTHAYYAPDLTPWHFRMAVPEIIAQMTRQLADLEQTH